MCILLFFWGEREWTGWCLRLHKISPGLTLNDLQKMWPPVFLFQPPSQKLGSLHGQHIHSIFGEKHFLRSCAAHNSMNVPPPPILTYLNSLFWKISNISKRICELNYQLSIHNYPCTPSLVWFHLGEFTWLPIRHSFEHILCSLGMWGSENRTYKNRNCLISGGLVLGSMGATHGKLD